jgi:hypothetical protein
MHAAIAESEIALSDLKKAIECFDAALLGYEAVGQQSDLKKLKSVRKKAKTRLKDLQSSASDGAVMQRGESQR